MLDDIILFFNCNFKKICKLKKAMLQVCLLFNGLICYEIIALFVTSGNIF